MCQENHNCVNLATFPVFPSIPVALRGIGDALPFLAVEAYIFRRFFGGSLTLVTVFPALFPVLSGGCFALGEVPGV
jgi:hypothetical protein